MKGIIISAFSLLWSVGSMAQAVGARPEQEVRVTSVLIKGSDKRFATLPILDAFPANLTREGKNFGFRIDSALMTRDLPTLLAQVEYLAGLEDASQTRSAYLTASALMDTTAVIFLRGNNSPYKWGYYSKAVALALQTGATHGGKLLKESAPEYEEYLKEREEKAREEKAREERAKGEKGSEMRTVEPGRRAMRMGGSGGGAPRPESRAAAAAPPANGPVLTIVNTSAKVLYVYLEDEYKGILYAGKSLQLKGLTGCWELSVESLDQFKSMKRHCFGPVKTQEWVIKN